MSTVSGSTPRDGLTAALADVGRVAARAGDALLHHVPDTGDLLTGRVVDEFVEQASDALRALAESVGETLALMEASESRADGVIERHRVRGDDA